MSKKIIYLSFAALFMFVLTGLSEATVRVRKLGDPKTAFYSPDIKTQDDLNKMLQARRADIQQVLTQAGWRGNAEDLLRALDAGQFSVTTISTGTQMPFMAARKGGRPKAMLDVIYEGPSFEAYYVDFESGGTGWRFYAPKICSNFWLEERAIEKPAPPPPPPPPPPAPAPAPPPAPEVAPPAPEAAPPVVESEGRGLFFIGGFLGKERRNVEVDTTLGIFDADCETLLGVKGGILPSLGHNAEAELAVGGKFVISDDDDNDGDENGLPGDNDNGLDSDGENSIFVDAAVHALFGRGGFVGGGVSFWDLTDDDRRTVSLLIQVGFGTEKVQFSAEARAPFEDFDDLENNYMFWAGIRIRP